MYSGSWRGLVHTLSVCWSPVERLTLLQSTINYRKNTSKVIRLRNPTCNFLTEFLGFVPNLTLSPLSFSNMFLAGTTAMHK